MASKLVPSGSVNAVTKFAGSKYAPGILNGGLSGGVQNVTDYVTNSNGNWTVKGALATGTSGMVSGAATAGLQESLKVMLLNECHILVTPRTIRTHVPH